MTCGWLSSSATKDIFAQVLSCSESGTDESERTCVLSCAWYLWRQIPTEHCRITNIKVFDISVDNTTESVTMLISKKQQHNKEKWRKQSINTKYCGGIGIDRWLTKEDEAMTMLNKLWNGKCENRLNWINPGARVTMQTRWLTEWRIYWRNNKMQGYKAAAETWINCIVVIACWSRMCHSEKRRYKQLTVNNSTTHPVLRITFCLHTGSRERRK